MGFGNSEQNFGMIALKFTLAMWYTHPKLETGHTLGWICRPLEVRTHPLPTPDSDCVMLDVKL